MKIPALLSLVALLAMVLAGCPEKKPEGDGPATAKPASSAPANAPAPPPTNAKPAGGW
jgi:hypothetical protein